ncbi:MAG: glutamate--cysteine ligase [Burkholderiaceae bacterium]|jgi:glutamate--cysteine ligase|nr:glutamate--cysteine ligase [Burkholderiaceae bacterium]
MVPHLVTALSGPINELEQRILDATPVIERWFRLEWMEHTPPLYCSVDIRNAGFKLAPVAAELFPRGWHNLSEDVLPLAVQAGQAAIQKICPEARNLLIVPASGKPSGPYLANLAQLGRIFRLAGLNVRYGSIDPAVKRSVTHKLPGGAALVFEPALRSRYRLGLKHFDPCVILLDDDLAHGTPGILEDLHEQYLLPPLQATWPVRRRSRHASHYEEVSKRFGKLLGIDPWLIQPLTAHCQGVDARKSEGLERLHESVNTLLARLRRKHKEYGIADKPFVLLKPDCGAVGADVLALGSAAELGAAGGKPAHKALTQLARGGDVIVQEGVPTCERLHDMVAEPSVYLIDRYVVGGYYRMYADAAASLGAPAAGCVPLAFDGRNHLPHAAEPGASAPNRFYMYGVIARVALVVASYELEATDPQWNEEA